LQIANQLFVPNLKNAQDDFQKLQNLGCNVLKDKALLNKRIGNITVDTFTFAARLNTKSKLHVTFYDIWQNRKAIAKQYKYIRSAIAYSRNRKTKSELLLWKNIFNMYYGAITIFKPIIAMYMYCIYKPSCVLDFTMGWGGRMVGACAINVKEYIGIDSNLELKEPYKKMTEFMHNKSTTKCTFMFQDALTVDYDSLHYDMVLTSPPYYNTEVYGPNKTNTKREKQGKQEKQEKQEKWSKHDWNESFYIPLIKATFRGLLRGGYYCLNVPVGLYESVCVPILGQADTAIPMSIVKRLHNYHENPYQEFIYVWHKT